MSVEGRLARLERLIEAVASEAGRDREALRRVLGILESQQREIEHLRRELHRRHFPATSAVHIAPIP